MEKEGKAYYGSEAGKYVAQRLQDRIERTLKIIEENRGWRARQTILRHGGISQEVALKATNHDFAELHASSNHSVTVSVGKQSVIEGTGYATAVVAAGEESVVYDRFWSDQSNALICTGEDSAAKSAGTHSLAATTAERGMVEADEDYSAAITVEENSVALATGRHSLAACTTDFSMAVQDGEFGGAAVVTDTRSTAKIGRHCRRGIAAATSTGSYATAECYGGAAVTTGIQGGAIISSAGEACVALAAGGDSFASVDGKDNIAIAAGVNSKAKGMLGDWIICVERESSGKILCVKSAEVDGINIMPDVYYMLKNGDFVEIR